MPKLGESVGAKHTFKPKKHTFLFYYGPLFTYRTEPPDS